MSCASKCYVALLALLPVFSWAQTATTALVYTYGEQFTEPNNPKDLSKHTLSLNHVQPYRFGIQQFSASWIQSDDDNPVAGGRRGAREIYGIYRNHLALSRLSGERFAFGPVREVFLTVGIDMNTKNDAFGARKKAWRIGPTFDFDLPGQLTVGLLWQKEDNHTALPAPRHDVSFDLIPVLATQWALPFRAAGQGMRFEGNLEYRAAKGKDYWNRDTAAETQLDTALLFDLGGFGLGRETVWVGPAYQYWHNKMGNQPGVGTLTSTPMLRLKWFF